MTTRFPRVLAPFLAVLLALAALLSSAPAIAQEPAACLSSDPSAWPQPSRPYFMMAMDTSGSMAIDVGSANSCGFGNTRLGHARCAYRNTILAYAGQVNFGLATFDIIQDTCTNDCVCLTSDPYCFIECDYFCYQSEINTRGTCSGCGPKPGNAATASGAFVRVPMLQDHFWANPPDAPNSTALLQWADNACNGNTELFANGNTPLNGMLRDMKRYYGGTWVSGDGLLTYPSPLASQDLPGAGVNGSTGCRSVNVILVTDGDETCDTQADAVAAAADLYQNGVTVGGKVFKIRTHVINFAGGNQANTDQIAAAGGTTASYFATNEVQLSQALANIVAGSASPEVCDNKDNNCNGCTDEGSAHYCDVLAPGFCCTWSTIAQRTACGAGACQCCTWGTQAARTTCLNNYTATITPANPSGDLNMLPCTTAAQQTQPANWLCYNPGEKCDNVDNNCQGGVDDGVLKCGSPLHCPTAEVCNGGDDDCDGLVDEAVCAGCVPSPEVCDGCDNDCDGMTDDGVGSLPCGQMSPPNCAGTLTCKPPQAVPIGTCAVGGGFNSCSNSPQAEVCDGVDNDCDGTPDDGVPATSCVPVGTPPGLVYGGTSQCVMGTKPCNGACTGFIGPSSEICDGIDNDCDGVVDDGAFGAGQACGNSQPPCSAGTTACVAGGLVCQGGVGPQPEICDGIDNDCDAQTDEAPLVGGPAPGANGCWANAGNCCTFANLAWCPPPGATCNGNGVLTSPCNKGALVCVGAAGWTCQGPSGPSPEACDGLDNNCNGSIDDGTPAPVGQSCGTNTGECTAGVFQCSGGAVDCVGDVGATAEVCDGLDNDCDGTIDDNVPGAGNPCGNATPPCTAGVTACVGGSLVCQGGVGPQAEQCDGIDNDCDTQVDEAPLADAPPPAQTGCWNLPGNCCTHDNFSWCPPAGATCSGNGALTPPCAKGTLTCSAGGWTCQGPVGPSAEVCDGVDNDCDGNPDDVAAQACVPPGTPAGLVYGGTSQCVMGSKTCGACAGFIGPSAEICDGIDNDCDGTVDDAVPGVGQACGVNQPPCTAGMTACVGGAIICQGGTGPQPEVCDGVDNDCDGTPDDAPLADAPMPGQNGCWAEVGNCCTFANLAWCPPGGATCNGNGSLVAPCNKGILTCAGGGGWVCQNPKGPAPEACDGLDNDCNGAPDDAMFPQEGQPCGTDTGECSLGAISCTGGILDCVGDVGPTSEICDGLDNDCDGQTDNGIPIGGPCVAPYDANLYPGVRDNPPCQPGNLQCNGMGGLVCVGGVGPTPELCDGIDNDCDGTVDEVGAAPDGLDGSQNPFPPPDAAIGDACGVDTGECQQGNYACVNGLFACLGGQGAVEETCDCADNDCNGVQDNQNPPGGTPLCGPGKNCVSSSAGCQCAALCGAGEIQCPPGQKCETVTSSETGQVLGDYCIVDACPGGCADKTVMDANDKVLCAPQGTVLPGCVKVPACECKGQNGCNEPCFNVSCPVGSGLVCTNFGPDKGTCVLDNCFNLPCQGCDQACNLGACVENPCKADSCQPGEVCKPKDNFTAFDCIPSCADAMCPAGEACVNGQCVATCDPECAAGQVCDTTQSPPTCVADQCTPNPCTDGSCCDPLSGMCGNCPCEGVLCPDGQECKNGDCVTEMGTGGGSATSSGQATSTGTDATTTAATGGMTGASSGGNGGAAADNRVWGLPTGGGGCACEVGANQSDGGAGRWALLALAMAAVGWRRSRRAKVEVAR